MLKRSRRGAPRGSSVGEGGRRRLRVEHFSLGGREGPPGATAAGEGPMMPLE